MRAFKTTFLVAIDEEEAAWRPRLEATDEELPELVITLEDVKNYLKDALSLNFDNDEYGNPCGVVSMEVHLEELQELPPDEVARLYNN